MRPRVEQPDELLELARNDSVALLIVGDPMQATTHIDLEARCNELDINFNIVPGITGYSRGGHIHLRNNLIDLVGKLTPYSYRVICQPRH